MDPQRLLDLPVRVQRQTLTRRDTILYALGVGAGRTADELDLVFEHDLVALPTMAVILGYPGFWQAEPFYGIDWRRVLHAEQSVEIHRALPVEGEIRGEMRIDAIADKGAEKGALLRVTRAIFDERDNSLLATVRQVSFLRGDGGRGGGGALLDTPRRLPEHSPDVVLRFGIREEQALLYRLSGDLNPVHADPRVAAAAGLPAPVVHGLCTYGIVGRMLTRALCGSDWGRLSRLDSRFTAPVFPGDAIELAIWRDGATRAGFRVSVPARSAIVIDNGYAEFDGPRTTGREENAR